MGYSDYPNNQGAEYIVTKRSPGIFTVVLTSVITSGMMTLILLFVTGNLSLSLIQEQKPPEVAQHHLVPSLVGLPVKSAKDLLKAYKLRMIVKAKRPDKEVEQGLIIEQEPLADSELAVGEEVAVVVSLGMPKPVVPKVVGKLLDEAKKLVEAEGIAIGEIAHTGKGDPGTVTKITPGEGATLAPDTKVNLVVVPTQIEVPKLIGMRTAAAKEAIKKAGFKLGKIRWRYNEYRPANLILGQDPKPGTKADPGAEIGLIINEE